MMRPLIIIVNELIIFYSFNYISRYITTHHPLNTVGCLYGRYRPVRNRLSALQNNVKQPVADVHCFSSAADGESDESECLT